MPYFELQCRSCKTQFDLDIENDDTLKDCFCVICHSKDLEIEGFDNFKNLSLRKLSIQIANLEHRINCLENDVYDLEDSTN